MTSVPQTKPPRSRWRVARRPLRHLLAGRMPGLRKGHRALLHIGLELAREKGAQAH